MHNIYLLLTLFVIANYGNIIIEPQHTRSYWCRQGGMDVIVKSSPGVDIHVYNIEKSFIDNKDVVKYSDIVVSDRMIRIDLMNSRSVLSVDVIVNISCFISEEYKDLCTSTSIHGIIVFLFLLLIGLIITSIVLRCRTKRNLVKRFNSSVADSDQVDSTS